MSPHCEETARGLQRLIAIPHVDGPVDYARLNRAVAVGNFAEKGNGYNVRMCSAQVTVGSRTGTFTYRVRQSEGLQNWYDIEFLQPDDPNLAAISAEARAEYEAGA